MDARLSRRVSVVARRALEVRLEVFNAFNRRNGSLPDSFIDHPTFGQSLAAFAPRQWQIAARFAF
jgi:hypothetical protein